MPIGLVAMFLTANLCNDALNLSIQYSAVPILNLMLTNQDNAACVRLGQRCLPQKSMDMFRLIIKVQNLMPLHEFTLLVLCILN